MAREQRERAARGGAPQLLGGRLHEPLLVSDHHVDLPGQRPQPVCELLALGVCDLRAAVAVALALQAHVRRRVARHPQPGHTLHPLAEDHHPGPPQAADERVGVVVARHEDHRLARPRDPRGERRLERRPAVGEVAGEHERTAVRRPFERGQREQVVVQVGREGEPVEPGGRAALGGGGDQPGEAHELGVELLRDRGGRALGVVDRAQRGGDVGAVRVVLGIRQLAPRGHEQVQQEHADRGARHRHRPRAAAAARRGPRNASAISSPSASAAAPATASIRITQSSIAPSACAAHRVHVGLGAPRQLLGLPPIDRAQVERHPRRARRPPPGTARPSPRAARRGPARPRGGRRRTRARCPRRGSARSTRWPAPPRRRRRRWRAQQGLQARDEAPHPE